MLERTFNLGDYKSLRATADASGGDLTARKAIAIEEICDTYYTLYTHQLVSAKLYGKDTEEWEELLVRVESIRNELLSNLKENEDGIS